MNAPSNPNPCNQYGGPDMNGSVPAFGSGGDTVQFLALSGSAAQQAPVQAQAQQAPVQPQPVQAWDVPSAMASPVNPLIAARGGSTQQSGAADAPEAQVTPVDLYPFAEPVARPGRNLDASFAEEKRRKLPIILGILAVLVIAAVAAVFVIRGNMVKEATAHIEAAAAAVQKADAVIVPMDSAVMNDLDPLTAGTKLADALTAADDASAQLDIATEELAMVDGNLSFLDPTTYEAVTDLRASITNRRTMLDLAQRIEGIHQKYNPALTVLQSLYDGMTWANGQADAAVAYMNSFWATGSADDLASSVNTTGIAYNGFSDCITTLDGATDLADVDTTALRSYLVARQAQLNYQYQAYSAQQAGDTATVAALATTLDEAAAASEAALNSLPADPTSMVSAGLSSELASPTNSYSSCREACVLSDADVNAYLGKEILGITPQAQPLSDVVLDDATGGDDVPEVSGEGEAPVTTEGEEAPVTTEGEEAPVA